MKKRLILLPALALGLVPLAQADITYTFSLDTTPLIGHGTFMVDLQFLDGSGLPGDLNNNTVKLTSFAFGGGSASGGGTAAGGASGSLASGVMLKDTAFFNEYLESFTPGTLLAFTIVTTNVLDGGGTPDLFTLAILDHNGIELPTNGSADEFLDVTLAGGANPQVETFGSAPGGAFSLAAPDVQPFSPAAVPEPSTCAELLTAMLGVGVLRLVHARK